MPAIVDDEPMGGGAPISIFESGPIMMYLAEKTGRFYPQDPRSKYDVAQWVGWQLANQGPKLGEQGHFRRAAEAGNNGDLTYALRRFDNETHRIFGVMNLGLFNKRYLAAGQYTIADMICYPWASSWSSRKIDIDEFPNVKSWLAEIGERPAVKKAMAMGPEFREDPASIGAEEQAGRRKSAFEATPIVAEGTMYLSTPFNRVVALDPETGREKWSFDPKIDLHAPYSEGLINRGVTLWTDPGRAEGDACRRRIFLATI